MTYSVEIYLTGTECGTVIPDLTLSQAHQAVSDYASQIPDLQPADWCWNIWDGSDCIESGPVAGA